MKALFLEFSDFQDCKARIKDKMVFSIISYSTKAMFLTELSMNEIKAVVAVKYEIEKRYLSKLITLFREFRQKNKFLIEGTVSKFFQGNGWPQDENF